MYMPVIGDCDSRSIISNDDDDDDGDDDEGMVH
jgi:hypothetical protein